MTEEHAAQPAETARDNVHSGAIPLDWNQVITTMAPHVKDVIDKGFALADKTVNTVKETIEAVSTAHRQASLYRSCLLALIVVGLVGLAFWCVYLNHMDTAEKIVIALVSFLGGTAIFGSGSKGR